MARAKNNTRVIGYNTIICPHCGADNGTFQGSMTALAFACIECGTTLGVTVVSVYQVETKDQPTGDQRFIAAIAERESEDLGL